jgi:Domain of unknown function (DUF4157)/A nuclease family of the HNH/ENDO VII superfamily with conserved AHH
MARENPNKKRFASLQMETETKSSHQQWAEQQWLELDALTSWSPLLTHLPAIQPPDPELIEQITTRIWGEERNIEVMQARINESLEQAKSEQMAMRSPDLETKLAQIRANRKASEIRVNKGFQTLEKVSDEVLFGSSRPLSQVVKALEAETRVLQEAVEVSHELNAAAHEPEKVDEAQHFEPTIPEGITADLHAQLEVAVGESLPQFDIRFDTEADSQAKSIGAIAFTMGNTIYFQSGKFDPASIEGFKLLVHEAAHIAQQAKGQAQPGVDSSPELEQAAQQRADQVSSPAKKFTPQELNMFAGQLTAQYKQFGSNPERFSSISESWFGLPEQARNGVRSRFMLGRNEKSLETEKINQAFDSKVNQALESKRLEEVKAAREQAFKAPSGINVQVNISRQAQVLPGFIGQQVRSPAQAVQRKETPDAKQTDAQYIQAFKEAMSREAIKRLEANRKKLNSDLAALKNTDANNPEWQRLRELSVKDGMLKDRWQTLAEQLQTQLRLYDLNLSDIVTYPDIGLSRRRGQIESAVRFSVTQSFAYTNQPPVDAASAQKQNKENEAKIQAVLAPILKTLEAASFIEDVQKALRIAYPALGVLNTPGQGGAFAKTKTDVASNQKALTQVTSGFNEIHKSINDLEGQLNQKDAKGNSTNVPVLELSAVMDAVLKQQGITEAARKSGEAKSKAVLDWLDSEGLKDKAIKIGGGVVTGATTIASLFTPAGWARLTLLGIGAAAGVGSGAYDVNKALTEERAANAGRGGAGNLTNTSPEDARFNTVMSFVNLALGMFDAAQVAGAAGKALKSNRVFETALQTGGRALAKANPSQIAEYFEAMRLKSIGKVKEAQDKLRALQQQMGAGFDDFIHQMNSVNSDGTISVGRTGGAAPQTGNAVRVAGATENLQKLIPDDALLKELLQKSGSAGKLESLLAKTGNNVKQVERLLKAKNWRDVEPFIGQQAGSDLPPGYHYQKNKNGKLEIHRARGRATDEEMAPLQIGDDGTFKVTDVVSNRLSDPRLMRQNFAAAYGQVKEGYWIHHLIPDEIVRSHPLMKLAREKISYALDRSSNLLGMADKNEWTKIAAGQGQKVGDGYTQSLGHWSSHSEYSAQVKLRLDEYEAQLKTKYGNLEKIPADRLPEFMKDLDNIIKRVENEFRIQIQKGQVPKKDGRLAWTPQEQPRSA